jgi:ABC-2 type transport system permease protein
VSGTSDGRLLGTGTPAQPASWVAMAAALTGNELRLAMRRGESLLATFVIPIGTLLVFSAFDVSGGTAAGRPVDRMLPGSMALAVIAAAMVSLAIATGFERSYGVIKRLGGSPAGASAVVASKTVSVIVIEAVQAVLLVGIALSIGWAPGPAASAPLLVAGLVAGTVAFAGFGLLMAGTLRAEATLALANLLFLLSLVVGGIVLPLEKLPGAVASVASVLPPATLTRVLSIGLGGAGDATEPLILLAGWAALFAVLASRRFRWD